jgi:hypothetical protein
MPNGLSNFLHGTMQQIGQKHHAETCGGHTNSSAWAQLAAKNMHASEKFGSTAVKK